MEITREHMRQAVAIGEPFSWPYVQEQAVARALAEEGRKGRIAELKEAKKRVRDLHSNIGLVINNELLVMQTRIDELEGETP